jgi:hypothetical protein
MMEKYKKTTPKMIAMLNETDLKMSAENDATNEII